LSLAIDHGVPVPPESAHDTSPPASMTIVAAELLGRRTAELHRHLAGLVEDTPTPDHPIALRPEPFSLHWQRSILQTVRSSLRATQRELSRRSNADAMSEIDRQRAQLLAEHANELLGRFDRLRTTKVDAKRMRIHGDLHLGQVLWTGHDVMFIDFEGEPGTPIGQRRIKRSPLGDVAGLLRSFDYAGRVAVHTADERGRVGPSDLDAVHRWRAEWTAAAQRALLDAYLDRIDGADLIPADRNDVALLLDIYTLTKCLYEVRYELANRPHWVGWPLAAIADLFPSGRR
jgi:maltose alpha-D-glucosyltransferase/alpha-amylase